MADIINYRSRHRDVQDAVERGVWGKREDVDGAGSIISVRGTGTVDYELPVINFGYSFNLPENSNTEVIMLSLGSDVNDKVALPVLPRNYQYQWPVGTGGVQHPTDPDRRIEFNGEETFLRDGRFVVGSNREVVITVDGSNVTITTGGAATIEASSVSMKVGGAVAIESATLTHNGVNIGADHRHQDSGGPGLGGVPA